jgi:hypothetical protein
MRKLTRQAKENVQLGPFPSCDELQRAAEEP